MANLYSPTRVESIEITLKIDLGLGGDSNRKMTFTAARNGAETVRQLADLMLSACDLALAASDLALSKAPPD